MAWTVKAVKAKDEIEAEVLLYDEIGEWWGKSAKDFVKEIKDLGDVSKITLRINSAGGEVFDAQAMYSYLRTHRAYKTVRIDGLAASAASFLAMVGDKIIMPINAIMMIHNPATFAWGEAKDMRKAADFLDKVRDIFAAVYVVKTGLDDEKIKSMMDEETWMSADEALSLGFCDETDAAAYERGVQAERGRLKALDGLTGTGREAIIAKAKYDEPKDARDIAIELLQASANAAALEARQSDAAAVNAVLVPTVTPTAQEAINDAVAKVADEINAMRGYKK
jgi:ATP-dependent protease ClpP protease subunit